MNLISTGTDWQLVKVRDQIVEGESEAENIDAVESILDSLPEAPSEGILDLVGHSVGSECYLKLGTSIIQNTDGLKDNVRIKLKPHFRELGVTSLRLLGCSTATTDKGWATMQAIAQKLDNVEVFGTSRIIYAKNFDAQGFTGLDALHSHKRNQKATSAFRKNSLPEAKVDIPLTPELIRRERRQELPSVPWVRRKAPADVEELWDLIDPDVAWFFPGLLTLPLLEVLVPLGRNDVHRVQVLLKYELVRVFAPQMPDRDGLVYRVTNPAALSRVCSLLPPFWSRI